MSRLSQICMNARNKQTHKQTNKQTVVCSLSQASLLNEHKVHLAHKNFGTALCTLDAHHFLLPGNDFNYINLHLVLLCGLFFASWGLKR